MPKGRKVSFVFIIKRCLCAVGCGRFVVFIARYSVQRTFFNFYCPPVYKRSLLARIIGQKNAKIVLVLWKNYLFILNERFSVLSWISWTRIFYIHQKIFYFKFNIPVRRIVHTYVFTYTKHKYKAVINIA